MNIATIIQQYYTAFTAKYKRLALPDHLKALHAMASCRTIVLNQNGQITFRYIESKTGRTRCSTLNGEDFLFLILQHVLPKGFRRVRDYGFLHSNAKKLLSVVQLILRIFLKVIKERPRPAFMCSCTGIRVTCLYGKG